MATARGMDWEHAVGALGLGLLIYGSYQGLFVLPPDRFMGDVMRILYVHVPAAWSTLLCFTLAFVCAIGWLWKGTWRWDVLGEAATQVGLVFGVLLTILGSIWARPTWGVWWDWDPRLTTVAIMLVSFGAVTALRSFVDDPERRATWSAIAAIVSYVDVPVVYFSVKWWRSLHQMQSSPSTVDPDMVMVLRINAFAFLFLAIWFIARHYRLIHIRRDAELGELS
jgi:heme exporter protein C